MQKQDGDLRMALISVGTWELLKMEIQRISLYTRWFLKIRGWNYSEKPENLSLEKFWQIIALLCRFKLQAIIFLK